MWTWMWMWAWCGETCWVARLGRQWSYLWTGVNLNNVNLLSNLMSNRNDSNDVVLLYFQYDVYDSPIPGVSCSFALLLQLLHTQDIQLFCFLHKLFTLTDWRNVWQMSLHWKLGEAQQVWTPWCTQIGWYYATVWIILHGAESLLVAWYNHIEMV